MQYLGNVTYVEWSKLAHLFILWTRAPMVLDRIPLM
jgi:hypothetical protein